MTTEPQKHDPYAALRVRDFRILTFARLAMTISGEMLAVILGWQIYDLTHAPLALGLAGLAEAVPLILVSLYAGHVVDRTNRKTVVVVARSVLTLSALILLLLSLDAHAVYQQYGTWPFYGTIFLSGLAIGFVAPADFALRSDIIPKELYANSVTWGSSTWQVGAIAGPAIGGLVLGNFGVITAYAVAVALSLFGASTSSLVKYKHVVRETAAEPIKESLLAGVRFLRKSEAILASLSLDLFAVLFGGAMAMLPVYARDILHAGPQEFGMLRAAPSVGAVIIAFTLAHRPLKGAVGMQMIFAVVGFGAATIVFGLSTWFWLSLAALFLAGAFDGVSVVIRSTVIQVMTPPEMRGRVSAINSIFISSSNEIGAFESGLAATLLGVVPSVVFGGAMTLITVAITAMIAPRLRGLRGEDLK